MGECEFSQARVLLAAGQHGAALESMRRARRRRQASGALAALIECEALFGLRRWRDAIHVATRALRRGPVDADLAARLRIERGRALWMDGRVPSALGELRRGLAQASHPVTRGRAEEALAFAAWRAQDLGGAAAHLQRARAANGTCAPMGTEVRLLQIEAGVARDRGHLEDALEVQRQRMSVAQRLSRPDLVAAARADCAGILAALGRWSEAEAEAAAAGEMFRRAFHIGESAAAAVAGAVVDLVRGELPRARAALDTAREGAASRGDARALAEVSLLMADLHLATRDAAASERAAVEALHLFRGVRDGEGECRARVRRAHALVDSGRAEEAVAEGRRALRGASAERPDLTGLALVALGRALLRTERLHALRVFDRLEVLDQSTFRHSAVLGRALALRKPRDCAEVAGALRGLEAWGDRRILSYALADVHDLAPAEVPRSWPEDGAPVIVPSAPAPVAAAAEALLGGGDFGERWAAAMHAIGAVVPWWRAAMVGPVALELRRDLTRPVALTAGDVAREVAVTGGDGPSMVRLDAGRWSRHPTVVVHRLAAAAVVPAGPGFRLYVDVREGDADALGAQVLGIVCDVGRLLAGRPPEEAAGGEAAPQFSGIVGRCVAMEELLRCMARVAASDLTVHVSGETGTGKEAVTKAIHAASPRAPGPFVAVNASSLGDELFEAEMFGHARGAYTGAAAERDGYVAAAEGGTLFLDEVADLTPRAQARLLRFLEEREYRRLGETRVRRANVRILTAANVPLDTRLRSDLVFRLDEVVLTLPPLRERGDDLWLLARHFLAQSAGRGRVPALAPDARAALAVHHWPGNVRELRREIRRAVVWSGGTTVRREHLSHALAAARVVKGSGLKDAVATFEREYVGRELARHGRHRQRTAAALGITRQALAVKMARLAI